MRSTVLSNPTSSSFIALHRSKSLPNTWNLRSIQSRSGETLVKLFFWIFPWNFVHNFISWAYPSWFPSPSVQGVFRISQSNLEQYRVQGRDEDPGLIPKWGQQNLLMSVWTTPSGRSSLYFYNTRCWGLLRFCRSRYFLSPVRTLQFTLNVPWWRLHWYDRCVPGRSKVEHVAPTVNYTKIEVSVSLPYCFGINVPLPTVFNKSLIIAKLMSTPR